MATTTLLTTAAGLVVLAGLFAMTEAALAAVSPARAGELAREGGRGSKALQAVAADAPRHINPLLVLGLPGVLVASTLVAAWTRGQDGDTWSAARVAAVSRRGGSCGVVGVGPRTLGGHHAYAVGRAVAPLVLWLGWARGPLASLLNR